MNTLFEAQRAYVPKLVGEIVTAPVIVCGGMGGSALPALMLRFLGASPYVIVHRAHGVPPHLPEGTACIAISFSGNTEETMSFAEEALLKGMPLSVIASGGKLLQFAKTHGLSYVEVPAEGEPRDAILATTKALLALTGEESLLEDISSESLEGIEGQAQTLADVLRDSTPVFYTSARNETLGYIGKIQCNETAKIPSFSNTIPEFNHNEMQGFGAGENAKDLVRPFVAVFIRDTTDDARVIARMEHTERLLTEQGVRTARIDLPSETRSTSFIYGWWFMRSLARSLATAYNVPPDATPLIDEFKKTL